MWYLLSAKRSMLFMPASSRAGISEPTDPEWLSKGELYG